MCESLCKSDCVCVCVCEKRAEQEVQICWSPLSSRSGGEIVCEYEEGHTCAVWCVFLSSKDILNVHRQMEALVA